LVFQRRVEGTVFGSYGSFSERGEGGRRKKERGPSGDYKAEKGGWFRQESPKEKRGKSFLHDQREEGGRGDAKRKKASNDSLLRGGKGPGGGNRKRAGWGWRFSRKKKRGGGRGEALSRGEVRI